MKYHHIIHPTNNLILNSVLKWSLLIDNYSDYDSYIVLEDESGEYVGYLMYYDNHVYKLEVKDKNKGYGRKLLQKFEEVCKINGFIHITLIAMNFDVISFYRKCGFEIDSSMELGNMKKYLEFEKE